MRNLATVIAILTVLVGTNLATAETIYELNLTPNDSSISGTIETDGTVGTLGLANILDYSLLLDDSVDTVTINPANSSLSFSGPSALSATATELLFDFSASASNVRFYYSFTESWKFVLASQPSPNEGIIYLTHSFDATSLLHEETEGQLFGSQVIGTLQSEPVPSVVASLSFPTSEVPEPSVLASLIVAACCLFGYAWVQRRKQVA
jgi:hypothetical protein